MLDPAERRELLFARVVVRLTALRAAGVMHEPCEFSRVAPPEHSESAALLWNWARLLGDAHELIHDVFEPAMREPGREHLRRTTEHPHRPRGATNWPQTSKRSLRRGQAEAPRFVCTTASRSIMMAPENMLLVQTLDEVLARGAHALAWLEGRRLLGHEERALIRHHRRSAAQTLATAWVASCRAALREHQRLHAPAELEREVEDRVRGRPSAAPDWARRLLELRRATPRVPRGMLATIDDERLWQDLAWLEVLTGLHGHARLHQQGVGFRGREGELEFRPLPETPAWILARRGAPAIAVFQSHESAWQAVRRDSLYWSWTATHHDVDIDRWLILHRASDGPLVHARHRKGIELEYCRVEPERGLATEISATLARWLARA